MQLSRKLFTSVKDSKSVTVATSAIGDEWSPVKNEVHDEL